MKKISIIAIIIIVVSSCTKYEEGPGFSILSKNKRLCREWTLDKIIENDEDITTQYLEIVSSHTLLFMDYGSLKETISTTVLAKGWSWSDKKETIVINYNILTTPYEYVFEIKRLSKKEFWYNTTIDQDNYEFYWKAE